MGEKWSKKMKKWPHRIGSALRRAVADLLHQRQDRACASHVGPPEREPDRFRRRRRARGAVREARAAHRGGGGGGDSGGGVGARAGGRPRLAGDRWGILDQVEQSAGCKRPGDRGAFPQHADEPLDGTLAGN